MGGSDCNWKTEGLAGDIYDCLCFRHFLQPFQGLFQPGNISFSRSIALVSGIAGVSTIRSGQETYEYHMYHAELDLSSLS